MKKEIKIESVLEEFRNTFHENFDKMLDELIVARPFKKIIIKIDVNLSNKEPFLIITSDSVCEVIINFYSKPNKEIFLKHVKNVLKQIE